MAPTSAPVPDSAATTQRTMDGSSTDVPDTKDNEEYFVQALERPGQRPHRHPVGNHPPGETPASPSCATP